MTKPTASILRKFKILNTVDDATLDTIGQELLWRQFAAGDTVVAENSATQSLFLVETGQLLVTLKGVPIAELSAGDFFGEMSLLKGDMRQATVNVIEPTTLWELPEAVFSRYLRHHAGMMYEIASELIHRLTRHNQVVVDQYFELEKKYQELEESHRKLLHTSKLAMIGELTSCIAHEIKNPLSIVMGNCELLLDHITEGSLANDPVIEEYVKAIRGGNDRMMAIINGLRNSSRADNESDRPFDLNQTVGNVLSWMKPV